MHLNENQLNQTSGINYTSVINDSEFNSGERGNLDKLIEENSKLPTVKTDKKHRVKQPIIIHTAPELSELKKIYDKMITPDGDINIINSELSERVNGSKAKSKIVTTNENLSFPKKAQYKVNEELQILDKIVQPDMIVISRELEILDGFFKWYIFRYRTSHYYSEDILQDMKITYTISRNKGNNINYSKERALYDSFDTWLTYTNKRVTWNNRKRIYNEIEIKNFDSIYEGTPELIESALELHNNSDNSFMSAKFMINFYRLILKSCKDTIDKKIIKLVISGLSHSQTANELKMHRQTEKRRFDNIVKRFHELNNLNNQDVN
jgi:hypothetical protein